MKTDLEAIRVASDALLWVSETDRPFEAVRWDNTDGPTTLSGADVLRLGGHPSDSPVREVPLEVLFKYHAYEPDPNDPVRLERAPRYRRMLDTMRANLADVRGFKVGEGVVAEVRVYVVGRSTEGDWAGLSATSIET